MLGVLQHLRFLLLRCPVFRVRLSHVVVQSWKPPDYLIFECHVIDRSARIFALYYLYLTFAVFFKRDRLFFILFRGIYSDRTPKESIHTIEYVPVFR